MISDNIYATAMAALVGNRLVTNLENWRILGVAEWSGQNGERFTYPIYLP
jgi:hypothetical protein